ncbi:metallophosphoesterase [Alkalitalea saponilacus]|uniref:Calcineurin-like phosphoesterase domain-containing protein n=1 Tax=Alkalitalea saponilacus TaxID=889453 RepID=A0A1T5CCH4_9BACT|nr:metallophosphoesterase [Alkalitalea saponilacus]ASB49810.1 metallophosphoesterase [Alkalitalea saponilacus]SKB57129.1 hypothetical protein SAMN03080601_00760 [Alkalitalea saponilacus]
MHYQSGLIYLMIFLVIAIDVFLFWRWKKGGYYRHIPGRTLAILLFAVLPLVSIAGFIYIGYRLPLADNSLIYRNFGWILFTFLSIYSFKLIYSAFHGGGLLIFKKSTRDTAKKHHYPRITRRKFLSQVGIIMATAPFVSLMFGAFRGRFAFYTRHVRLSFPNLPEGFDGLRIAHISDLHLGSFGNNREPLREAVHLINAEHPDLILFTGDMVNNFAGEMDGWEGIFSKLKAPLGKFSVLGNHDYGNYSRWESKAEKAANFDGIISGQERMGFKVLKNESVILTRNGDSIGLGGVENWGTASYPRNGDLDQTSESIAGQSFSVLMSHDPDHWDQKVLEHGRFDLTLSGHTHGMQFGIEKGDFRWSPAQYVQKRWAGLYQEGDKFLYVNRGLGYHGLPARVGMPPEITIIELSRGTSGTEPM